MVVPKWRKWELLMAGLHMIMVRDINSDSAMVFCLLGGLVKSIHVHHILQVFVDDFASKKITQRPPQTKKRCFRRWISAWLAMEEMLPFVSYPYFPGACDFFQPFFFPTEASEPSVAKKVTFSTSMAIEHVALEDVYWLQCNLHRQVQSPQEGDNPWRFTYPQFSLLHHHHHHDCFAGDPWKAACWTMWGPKTHQASFGIQCRSWGERLKGWMKGGMTGWISEGWRATDFAEARGGKVDWKVVVKAENLLL